MKNVTWHRLSFLIAVSFFVLPIGLLPTRSVAEPPSTENRSNQEAGANDGEEELESLRRSERRQRTLAESRLYALQISSSLQRWNGGNTWAAWEVLNRTAEDLRSFEYGYLHTLYNWGQQRVESSHGGEILAVAYSPDGTRFATSSRDDTIKIWDAKTFKGVATLTGHATFVVSVAFGPDSKRVVSGDVRKGLKVWDVESGKVIRSLVGHTAAVNRAEFSRDGKRIVSASADGTARVWDVKTGGELRAFKDHVHQVRCATFSPDGQWVASGARWLRIWNAETGAERHFIRTSGTKVYAIAFNPDGDRILTGHWDARTFVQLWDAESGESVHAYPGFGHRINTLAFSPDGQTFAAGGYENDIRICSAETGKEIKRLTGHRSMVNGLCYAPDGHQIVSAANNEIRVWDIAAPNTPIELQSTTRPRFGPNGDRIATGNEMAIELRDARMGQVKQTLRGHTGRVNDVAFSPDGDRLASASDDGTLRVWDLESRTTLLTLKGHDKPVTTVAYSPKGTWLVSSDPATRGIPNGINHRIWNATTGDPIADLTAPARTHTIRTGFAFSPDDQFFVSSDPDQVIHVRDVRTGEKRVQLDGTNSYLTSLAFSPGGDRIAGAFSWPWGDGDYLKVWNAKTGAVLFAIRGRSGGWTPRVVFSPDGSRVMVPVERNIRTWDARTGGDPHEMYGHTSTVAFTEYLPNGKRIVSGGRDGTLKIWNADVGEELLSLDHGDTTFVTANHDGTRLLSATRNRTRPLSYTLKLWHADAWKP